MKCILNSLLIIFLMINISNAQFIEPNIINPDAEIYTSSFIAEWASDTASIETYTIMGNHMFGKAIHLYPEPHLRQFEFYFNSNGSIREMDIQFYELSNTSIPLDSKSGFLPYRIKMNANHEIVDFRTIDKQGEKQWIHKVPRMDFFGGWTPILGQWQWLTNLLLEERLGDDLLFLNYVIGEYKLELNKKSNAEIIFKSGISAPITFYTGEGGSIDSINAIGSPWNYKIYKTSPIDVESYTKRFVDKKVLGDPSPHDQTQVSIGDALILIDYGRPSKRGREIFGGLVPYGKVWRTGAGAPTTITTNRDLKFNNILLPKGTYNLFTIPNRSGWTLIFNTEKGAWGSAYRSEFDFAKTKMVTSKSEGSKEQFTIELKSTPDGGELIMSWDQTVASVRLKVDE